MQNWYTDWHGLEYSALSILPVPVDNLFGDQFIPTVNQSAGRGVGFDFSLLSYPYTALIGNYVSIYNSGSIICRFLP